MRASASAISERPRVGVVWRRGAGRRGRVHHHHHTGNEWRDHHRHQPPLNVHQGVPNSRTPIQRAVDVAQQSRQRGRANGLPNQQYDSLHLLGTSYTLCMYVCMRMYQKNIATDEGIYMFHISEKNTERAIQII